MKENVKLEALNIVREIEEKTNIYDIEVIGIKIWFFIRVYFYLEVVNFLSKELHKTNTHNKKFYTYLSNLILFLERIVIFLIRAAVGAVRFLKSGNSSIVFLIDPSDYRDRGNSLIERHIFFNSFYSYFKNDSSFLELLTLQSFSLRNLLDSNDIIFIDFAFIVGFIRTLRYLFLPKNIVNWDEFLNDIRKVNIDGIQSEWIEKEILKLIERHFKKVLLEISVADVILQKIKPKLIVETRSYNGEVLAFNYVAKKSNIQVVEFQHGIITESHIGYTYFVPKKSVFLPLPDKIFLFGDVFVDFILKRGNAFTRENLIVSGFPKINKYRSIGKSELEYIKSSVRAKLGIGIMDFVVTFTTQPFYRNELIRFLKDILPFIPQNVKIFVKLHPREISNRGIYETIAEKGRVFVLTDEDMDLYQVLLASDTHSTISSTVFLEAMALGIPNIIMELPGFESVSEINLQDCILFAKSSEDFIEKLRLIMREDIRNVLIYCGKEKAKQFYSTLKNPEKDILSILERTL
ncbi:hypothetical protein [Caldisericum sp.]|uniref:hypothetical protein n=1 Tax=Caldisericum sp. TaxID=2499687 RepID=UPI003D130833